MFGGPYSSIPFLKIKQTLKKNGAVAIIKNWEDVGYAWKRAKNAEVGKYFLTIQYIIQDDYWCNPFCCHGNSNGFFFEEIETLNLTKWDEQKEGKMKNMETDCS